MQKAVGRSIVWDGIVQLDRQCKKLRTGNSWAKPIYSAPAGKFFSTILVMGVGELCLNLSPTGK